MVDVRGRGVRGRRERGAAARATAAAWLGSVALAVGCFAPAPAEPAGPPGRAQAHASAVQAESRSAAGADAAAPAAPAAEPGITPGPSAASRRPGGPRIVAIGDLHGDLSATRAALRLAAVVDDADQWSGGRTIVVQTGDQIDRGDDDRAVVEWLHALREQAPRSGGAIHLLSGNHELMNVLGDMRYVTAGAFAAFEGVPGLELDAPELASVPPQARARVAAMRPGGPFARRFATQPVVLIVGDSVFAHGGLGAAEVTRGLDAVNAEVRALMEGTAADPAAAAARWMAPDGPLWRRDQSDPDSAVDCAQLRRTLNALGVTRLVVGHTVQAQGVTAACDGAVWRIDVGMSAHYGGPVEVLELVDGQVRVLRAEHP